MAELSYHTALIVGAGPGISAAVARALHAAGLTIGLAARNIEKLKGIAEETDATPFAADAGDPQAVAHLFAEAERRLGPCDVVLFNASSRVQGPLISLTPEAVRDALRVSAYGGFLVVREAAARMLPRGHGAILITGATASIKGFAGSAPFAMGKFALRGLAQSAARELGPKGIHVAHFIIDGGVRSAHHQDPAGRPDSTLAPEAIAQSYLAVLAQPRSAWSFETDLRPWVETF